MSSNGVNFPYLQANWPTLPPRIRNSGRSCIQAIQRAAMALIRDLGEVFRRLGALASRAFHRIWGERSEPPGADSSRRGDGSHRRAVRIEVVSSQQDLHEKLNAFKNIPRDNNQLFLQSVIDLHRQLMTPKELESFNQRLKESDPSLFIILAGWAIRAIVIGNKYDQPIPNILPLGQYRILSNILFDTTKVTNNARLRFIHNLDISDLDSIKNQRLMAWNEYMLREINVLANQMNQGNPIFFQTLMKCR